MNRRTGLVLLLSSVLTAGCPPPLPGEVITCEEADDCETTGSASSDGGSTPTTSGSVHTVTGDDDAPASSSTTTDDEGGSPDTTGEPAEPPIIVTGVVIPDFIDDNGVLVVEASTTNAEGVHLLLDTGEQIELTQVGPGTFTGEILVTTALDNGKHVAVLTPWLAQVEGEPVEVDYVIALPPLGYEIGPEMSGPSGSVVAIAVLPDGRPVEFGTYQDMGEPRCYHHLRDKHGDSVEFLHVLPGAYCRAIDLKIDRDTGRMHVLVEREKGDDSVWWAGEISAWGKGPKNIGTGAPGDTAFALAARPDVVAVCGSRAVPTPDKLDALAVLLRPGQLAEDKVFDYLLPSEPDIVHRFTEIARDCAFAGDTLVIVGETQGEHEQVLNKDMLLRDRLTLIEADVTGAEDTAWTVAGIERGIQTRALALDLDDQGRYHLVGDRCDDACEPDGALWIYEPGGKLVDDNPLGPLGSPFFGPHDIAWSPAGYAIIALGELQGQSPVFKVQAFAPGHPVPLWTFIASEKQGLALAAAVGPYGEVYAGGLDAFKRLGG